VSCSNTCGEKSRRRSVSRVRVSPSLARIHLASSVVHDIARHETYLRRLREAITALPNANVKDELVNADGPHRVLSLLSLWRLDTDHSQSSSSTNARTTSDATTRTSSRFKTYPHIHLHPRSRPTHRLRAHTPRHPPARARPKNPTPHIARARHRLAPPSRARSRRRTSTVETHPHPLARAIALVPFARTMTFVLVRQEKADRARGDSRTTTTTAPEAGRVGRIRTRTTTRHETPSSRAPDRVGSVVVPLVLDPFLMASRDRITRNRIPREIEGVNFFFFVRPSEGKNDSRGSSRFVNRKIPPTPSPP